MESVSPSSTDTAAPASPPNLRAGLTLRSAFLGLCVVVLICIGAPTSIWMVGSSEITWSFFPVSVGFSFIAIVLANGLVKKLKPSWGPAYAGADHHRHHGAGHQRHPDFHRRYAAVDPLQAVLRSHPGEPVGGIPAAVPAGVDHSQPRQRRHALLLRGLPARHAGAVRCLAGTAGMVAERHLRRLLPQLLRRRHAPAVGGQRAPGVSRDRGAAPALRGPAVPQPAPILNSRAFWIGCAVPLGVILFNAISSGIPACRGSTSTAASPSRCFPERRTSCCACTSRSSALST